MRVNRVEFDSSELVRKCVSALDSQLRVTPLQYTIQEGKQNDGLTDDQLRTGDGFTVILQDIIIPFAQLDQPVVGQHEGDLLLFGQEPLADRRDRVHAELFGRKPARDAGNDAVVLVNDDGSAPADRADAADNTFDMFWGILRA